MKTRNTLMVLGFALGICTTQAAEVVTLTSPNNKVSAKVSTLTGKTYLDVMNAEGKRMTRITLGLTTSTQTYTSLSLDSLGEITPRHEEYQTLHGKRSLCQNDANEVYIRMKNKSGETLGVEVRAWNDGVTFRYSLPDEGKRTFQSEETSYLIDNTAKRWLMPYNTSYEADYPLQEKGGQTGTWGFPSLFEIKNTFMLITEADANRMYCDTRLVNTEAANTYKVTYPTESTGDYYPTWEGEWHSPWRVVIVGELSDIAQSTLVEDNTTPCTMTNTDWIKPGRAAWVYWAYNHGTKDYQICKQYVDLAVEMGWEYVLFDWEWDQMSNGGTITDACKYATQKGIKPAVWYHSGDEKMQDHTKRVAEFKWLKSIGVQGVKIDFFDNDKQYAMNYFLDILEDARDCEMLVNFHGCTIPRGWSRPYPHLMATEAVFGAEQYNNGGTMTTEGARINCTFPFTRNVVGPMDYTPVAFTNSQHPHTTSFAHELALSVVFESGIQHWADKPEGFEALPQGPKQFMKEIPTAWDETRLLDGYPGERVIMARRKGENWYVGGLQGKNEEDQQTVRFDFLEEGKDYLLTLHADGDAKSEFHTTCQLIHQGDSIVIPVLPRGGYAMSIKPASTVTLEQLKQLQEDCENAITTAQNYTASSLGYYDMNVVEALNEALKSTQDVTEASSSSEIISAYVSLQAEWERFQRDALVAGGTARNKNLTQNVTAKYLMEARMFSRSDSPSTRFGIPAYWTVENYYVPNGNDGTKQGIDTYPGYNCITLGVWDDASGAKGNLKLAKLYRTVNLPAGKYFFGASYQSNYYLGEDYIFAATSAPTAATTVRKSLACAPISKFETQEDWGGVTFTLDEPTQLDLGWSADLTGGSEQEFRVRELALLRYLDEAEKWIESEAAHVATDSTLYIAAPSFAEAPSASYVYSPKSQELLGCEDGTVLTVGQIDLTGVTSVTIHSNATGSLVSGSTYELLLDNANTSWGSVPTVKVKNDVEGKTSNTDLPAIQGVHTLKIKIHGTPVNIWGITLRNTGTTAIRSASISNPSSQKYRLSGMAALNGERGILIENGKKVLYK